MPDERFHVYDTTLRDGAQQEGLTLTVADKLAIARRLDEFGVGYIEGGCSTFTTSLCGPRSASRTADSESLQHRAE